MTPHLPEPEPEASELGPAAARAAEALYAFGEWLQESREQMNGSYVLGKDTYSWHLRRVRLVPHGADELLAMAAMERARALSFFQFEQFKNRNLPQIGPAETAEEYLAWDDETSLRIRRFYKDLLTEPDYALPVKSSVGLFQPPFGEMYFPERQEDAQGGTPEKPARRIIIYPVDHWKWRYSNMGFRTAPGVLHMHEYYPGHYLERELHRRNPCPLRRGHRDPVHSQGWCFYNEEMPLMLDFPYARGPRAREQVYVNMYQRSLRVLQGIRLLDGQLTVNEALEWLTDRLPPNLGPSLGARPEEAFEETYPVIERGTTDTCMLGSDPDLSIARRQEDAVGRPVRFPGVPRSVPGARLDSDRALPLGDDRPRRRDGKTLAGGVTSPAGPSWQRAVKGDAPCQDFSR